MDHVLDNLAWGALNFNHQHLAYGNSTVKHYAKEVSPFVGLAENTDENFKILYDILSHDGPAGFTSLTPVEIPAQWQVLNSVTTYQMIYNGGIKSFEPGAQLVHLTDKDIPQMLELVKLTNPGPFGPRTIDFGHYYGVFAGDCLVAMAGQRMCVDQYTEVSAVCTHPDYLGKGYAKNLLNFQINRMVTAGNVPILHVRTNNHRAIEVYKRVGFEKRRELFFYYIKKA